jgi:anti-sigma B factor antagonist
MRVSVRRAGSHTIVAVSEVVDIATSAELRKYLADVVEAGARSLVLDLSDVRYLDSTGLTVLVETFRLIGTQSGGMVVVCGESLVRRVLEVTGLDRAFAVRDTLAEAFQVLDGPGQSDPPATEQAPAAR